MKQIILSVAVRLNISLSLARLQRKAFVEYCESAHATQSMGKAGCLLRLCV